VLRAAKTIVFNGPMGVYEKAPYQHGTRTIGEAIAEATRAGATSVVGGGDAAAAAAELGFARAMTHVSTGGGATLEFLEGKTLPGVAALER
jgi:phosphoglycerate kinase